MDDAIHLFVQETAGENAPALHGWALAFETSRLEPDVELFPLATAQNYSFGPQTTPSQAIGLYRYAGTVLETYLANQTLGLS
ncbi:hypothetical protein SEA_YELLOWPANDA_54 [Microbacterium phage YellowPanda]